VNDQTANPSEVGSTVHYTVTGSAILRDVNGVSFGGISYSGLKSVNLFGVDQPPPGLPANESLYTISSTATSCATQVDTGAAFATVEVFATAGNSILTVIGHSAGDQVEIGLGLTSNIAGTVSVSNPVSGTTLVVDDSQDTALSHQVLLSAGSVNGTILGLSAPILYDVNAVNAVHVKANSGGGSTYRVTGTVGNSTNPLTTLDTGLAANDVLVVATSANGPLQINDGVGHPNLTFDSVHIGNVGSVQTIQGNVTVNSPSPFTGLFVDDSADPTGRNVTLATGQIKGLLGQQAVLNFTPSIQVMDVKGGLGSDTFTIGDTLSSGPTTLETGAGAGVDTVFVQGTTGPLTVTGSENGTSPITVGKGGSLKGIKGNVLLQNPPDFNNVTVDGSADPAPTNATLALSSDGTKGRIIGLSVGEIDYATGDTSAVEVKTGTAAAGATGLITVANTMRFRTTTLDVGGGAYTVNVQATGGPLIVNGGTGGDGVNLGPINPNTGEGTLQNFQGPVTIHGSGGNPNSFPSVSINDEADTSARNVSISASQITGLTAPGAPINLSAASVAVLDIAGPFVGGSTFNINGTPAAEVLQVVAPGPGDVVNVQAAAAGTPAGPTTTAVVSQTVNVGQNHSLQAIQGTVEVANAVFKNFFPLQGISLADVHVDDSADTQQQTVIIGPNGVSFPSAPIGPITVSTGSAVSLTYLGGASSTGHDTYTLTGTPATNTLTLSAPGPDTVNVQATAAGTITTINGGSGGNHIFNVGSNSSNPLVSTLDGIQGVLNVNGGGATDTLNINDQGSTTPHIYNITTTTFTRSAPNPVTINYSNVHLVPNEGTRQGAGPQAAELAFPSSIAAGRFATLSGRLVGTGTLSLDVDWGDGTPPAHSTPDRRPFSLKHKYARPGTYHVRAIWTDSSGQSGFREMTIVVTAAGEGGDDR
jgi:hypothetical protein